LSRTSKEVASRLQVSLSGYLIERELGGGGMSRVFLALEQSLGRYVVLKVLPPEAMADVSADRFQREIRIAAGLQHPNIVPLLAAGVADGLPYYTMPFVEGLSLRTRLQASEPLSFPEIISILKDLLRAGQRAHERGIVHRDIKPENVLLSGDSAVITDFGIAKALSASRSHDTGSVLTHVGMSVGTPAYMSPEQASGDTDVDHRADLYSLGCLAFELVAGVPPFTAPNVRGFLAAHIADPPPDIRKVRPDTPEVLAGVIMRCLEKDASSRPQSARAVLQLLEEIQPPRKRTFTVPLIASAGVLALLLAAFAVYRATASENTLTPPRSIAVLPFESVGGDTAQTYFAHGIAEELITALSWMPDVRVAGRASSFRFRDGSHDFGEVARSLNVNSLLTGRVRRSGSQMRVSIELIDGQDGSVLWSESYNRQLRDALAMQEEIARSIANALRVRLTGAADSSLQELRDTRVDPGAYESYLKGKALLQRRGRYVEEAIPHLERAIAQDSSFARAWAQLGWSLTSLPLFSRNETPDLMPRALAAIRRALELDKSNSEARAALGGAYLFVLGDVNRAIPELEQAVRLDHSNADAWQRLALALAASGAYDSALTVARGAVEVDPMSAAARNILARVALYARRYDEAIASARRAIQLDPLIPHAPAQQAVAEFFLGRRDSAHAIGQRLADIPVIAVHRAFILAATGDSVSNRELVRSLAAKRSTRYSGEVTMAAAYLGMRDTARALDALERAAERRESFVLIEFGHPMFDPVRDSPRFLSVLRAYGVNPGMVNSVLGRSSSQR
jgi:eukaryotic-like serine/threonine-protein kinase